MKNFVSYTSPQQLTSQPKWLKLTSVTVNNVFSYGQQGKHFVRHERLYRYSIDHRHLDYEEQVGFNPDYRELKPFLVNLGFDVIIAD